MKLDIGTAALKDVIKALAFELMNLENALENCHKENLKLKQQIEEKDAVIRQQKANA